MKSVLFLLSIFLMKLVVNEVVGESNDNSNGIAIIEAPLDHEDFMQTTYQELPMIEADKIKKQVENLPDNSYGNIPKTKDINQVISYFDLPVQEEIQGLPIVITSDDATNFHLYDNPDMFNLLYEHPIYIHPSLKRRSDEDILEQLEHDAIMNNILPTMDFPFYRDAGSVRLQPSLQDAEYPRAEYPPAYYPTASGIPIVPIAISLKCSPEIIQGYRQNMLDNSLVPLPYYYRRHWQGQSLLDEYKK